MHIPDQESRGHTIPTRTYYVVAGILICLTAITVFASLLDWGAVLGFGGMLTNVVIALFIATIKASLVLVYFMHMKYESKLIWGYGILYPLVILSILLFFLFIDVFHRNS